MSSAEAAPPALPAGLQPLPDADGLRAADRWASESLGISGWALMQTAGERLADVVMEQAPEGLVVLVCGSGNNGGDGYVAARRLAQLGRPVRVVSTADEDRLHGDAATARAAYDGPVRPWAATSCNGAAVIVDAILGTGSHGAPHGPAAEAIQAILTAADEGVPVVACDIPSGVDAATGETAGAAVRASTTVTFHAAPPGLWITPGKTCAGELVVIDIGIPTTRAGAGPGAGLLHDELLAALPVRLPGGTKFRSGHVVVLGGSPGMSGAPALVAHGALRAGAGYVTIAAPASITTSIVARAPVEVLSLALPAGEDGAVDAGATPEVLRALDAHHGTLVLGPGLGRGPAQDALVRELARNVSGPLLVDADAFSAVAGDPEALRRAEAPARGQDARATVLTPHAGELSRLLGVDGEAVAARRLEHARLAAHRADAVVVLKGDDTLIVAPDGRTAISPGGVPGLATAGTGDVLAGAIGALLARGVEPFLAAAAGVWLHRQAGVLVTAEHGPDGVLAHEVAERLGDARRSGPTDR